MGDILIRHPITKMIYSENNFIKIREPSTIRILIDNVIDKLDFTMFEDCEDAIGEIYEYILNKYVKSNSKELGQFFTPRKLMKLILGYKKKDINKIFSKVDKEEISIYDSCMGTGGWLVSTFNMFKDKYENLSIAGGEVEPETYQYGLMNICLTLKKFPNDVRCKSSLTHVNKNKHHLITTNPPFNSKKQIKFNQIKNNFENDKYTTDNKIKISDIYNLKKDDPPIQFLELDTWKLEDEGMCIIVLPYGEFFSGSSYTKTREHFMNIVNITDIILVPGGIFTHTGIKTCVMIYKKDKKGTRKIKFSKINQECNKIEKITCVTIDDINKEPNLSWYINDYIIDNHVNELMIKMPDYEWIEFGKIFTLEKGQIQSSKVEEDEDGESVLINCSLYGNYKKINSYSLDGENLFISTFMPKGNNGTSYAVISYYNGKCELCNLMAQCIINNYYKSKINLKYVYYYLSSIKKHIDTFYEKGACNKSLDIKNFDRMKIPVPTIHIQNKFVQQKNLEEQKIIDLQKEIEKIINDNNNKFINMIIKND